MIDLYFLPAGWQDSVRPATTFIGQHPSDFAFASAREHRAFIEKELGDPNPLIAIAAMRLIAAADSPLPGSLAGVLDSVDDPARSGLVAALLNNTPSIPARLQEVAQMLSACVAKCPSEKCLRSYAIGVFAVSKPSEWLADAVLLGVIKPEASSSWEFAANGTINNNNQWTPGPTTGITTAKDQGAWDPANAGTSPAVTSGPKYNNVIKQFPFTWPTPT